MRVEQVTSSEGATIRLHSIGAGPAVIISPGAATTIRDYGRLAKRLSEHFTVYLFDRRGRRDSAPLTGSETPQTDVADLAAVLDHTGARNLFGHSGGGFVAMHAGLVLQLDRIATYDPAVAITGVGFPRGFIEPFEAAVAAGDIPEAFTAMGQIQPDSAAARMPHWLQKLTVRGFLHTPPGKQMVELLPTIGPEVRRILDAEGPASDYTGIQADVLLCYGSRSSRYFKDTCLALAAALPHAAAVEIPRASHNAANIAPSRLTDPLIQFFNA